MRPSTICQHNTLCKRCSFPQSRGCRVIGAGLRTGVCAALLVAILSTPGQTRAVSPVWNATIDARSIAAPPIDLTAWMERYFDDLRQLLQLLGGNPSVLNGVSPQAAMTVVYEQFEESGIDNLSEREVVDAISITAQLDVALAAQPASIDPGDFSKLKEIEAALFTAK